MPFKPDQLFAIIDYETYSEANLKNVGAYEYSIHPSTEIICASWRVGTKKTLLKEKIYSWAPVTHEKNFKQLAELILDPDITLVAHNAFFDHMITSNVFGTKYRKSEAIKSLPSGRWVCTASMVAALGLPRSVEGSAAALNLPVQKDKEGRRLILKWCKPRKATKTNKSQRHDDPSELERLIQYCEADVSAETHIFLACDELSDFEREVWLLDQQINRRGFSIDRNFVHNVQEMLQLETKAIDDEVVELTNSKINSARQRNGVLAFLEAEGFSMENLQKKTVNDTIASLKPGKVKRILELRSDISKSSTAKYSSCEQRSRSDGRLRDILVYHAATTGRFGGAGFQPHNLPRPSFKKHHLQYAVGVVKDVSEPIEERLALIRALYKSPMQVFSSLIRSVIVASKGKILDVADYSQIEVRVLFWLADHQAGLDAFRDKRDLYIELASKIYGENVTAEDTFKRSVGKAAILGCGYMMGDKRFLETCQANGLIIPAELSKSAVQSYRIEHKPVVQLWDKINRCAIAAVANPHNIYSIAKTKWFMSGDFLKCQLPSGRCLSYYKPEIRNKMTPWREHRLTLYSWSTNSQTKKWEFSSMHGGLLVENVCQAVARDIMVDAMVRAENQGWEIMLTVHDEILAERPLNNKKLSLEHFQKLLRTPPGWAQDIPLAAEGFQTDRYCK